ncbi:hypothetical protein DIPPA_27424 [Diplonema papillatum]|nr:hypothetical protein DIPPA_27424 [Diplonema papillatum]
MDFLHGNDAAFAALFDQGNHASDNWASAFLGEGEMGGLDDDPTGFAALSPHGEPSDEMSQHLLNSSQQQLLQQHQHQQQQQQEHKQQQQQQLESRMPAVALSTHSQGMAEPARPYPAPPAVPQQQQKHQQPSHRATLHGSNRPVPSEPKSRTTPPPADQSVANHQTAARPSPGVPAEPAPEDKPLSKLAQDARLQQEQHHSSQQRINEAELDASLAGASGEHFTRDPIAIAPPAGKADKWQTLARELNDAFTLVDKDDEEYQHLNENHAAFLQNCEQLSRDARSLSKALLLGGINTQELANELIKVVTGQA